MRSALPLPSAAMNTLKPSRFERVEPLRERVGVADDRIERARREHRRLGRVGHGEHRHRLRLRVREQPVERERQAGRVGVVDLRAPRGGERLRERGLLVEQFLRAVAQPAGLDDRDERGRRAAGRAGGARRTLSHGSHDSMPSNVLPSASRSHCSRPHGCVCEELARRGRGPRRSAAARAPGRSTTR